MKRLDIISPLLLLAIATAAPAATWHVAKDGSGDFTVIQEAVEAASPGDVIHVHAGRYTERTDGHDVWGNGTLIANTHVWVDKPDLTFTGDGTESTVIGEETWPGDRPTYLFGIAVAPEVVGGVSVTGFRIENVNYCIMAWNDRAEITNCDFVDFRGSGTYLFTEGGATVTGCRFDGLGAGVEGWWPATDLVVSDCEIVNSELGAVFVTALNVLMRTCSFSGNDNAINSQQGSHVTLEDCEMTGTPDDNCGVYVSLGAQAELTRCTITGYEVGIGVFDGGTGAIIVDDSTISGSSWVCIYNFGGVITVHDSDIINGGDWSVICNHSTNPDCDVDMTNNYWGTDSEDQIAEWISDAVDNPDLCCTVDFIPFDGPVATEPHSWSAVKGLFEVEE